MKAPNLESKLATVPVASMAAAELVVTRGSAKEKTQKKEQRKVPRPRITVKVPKVRKSKPRKTPGRKVPSEKRSPYLSKTVVGLIFDKMPVVMKRVRQMVRVLMAEDGVSQVPGTQVFLTFPGGDTFICEVMVQDGETEEVLLYDLPVRGIKSKKFFEKWVAQN